MRTMDTHTIVATLTSILPVTAAGIWTVFQYFAARSADRRRSDFEAFHKMIGSLPQGGSQPISPEAALASIYELRNYPAYFAVTRRILETYSARIPDEEVFAMIKREIVGTLEYIRARGNATQPERAASKFGFCVTSSEARKRATIFVSLSFVGVYFGGPGEIRTHDLFHAMEARSQLRHRPIPGAFSIYHEVR